MTHSLKIRLYTVLCTAFFVAELALHLPSVFATDWRRPGSQREAVEGPRGGGGGGGGISTPSYDYGAAQRAQEAAAAAEAERQRQAEAERKRLAEEKRQKDAAFIRERDASPLKGPSGTALNQLKDLSDTDNSGLKGSGGSGFDTGGTGLKTLQGSDPANPKARSKPEPHTDTSVVDARNVPSGLPKSVDEAIPRTPSGDRVRKGFQAIQAGDWKAALAWFQDARNKEPGNSGLGRLVDLAKFTLEYRTPAQPPAIGKNSTPVQAAQSPSPNTTTNSTGIAAVKSGDPAGEPSDNFLARTTASQMAARARAGAAFKRYVEKYGDRNVAGRTIAVSKAARGEGYSDEELKAQLQKALSDYRKNYRKNHPNGPADSVGGNPAAEEIILGGKG